MGTNFYFGKRFNKNPSHIGKRSAAGLYCWDCNESLCLGGASRVHGDGWGWHDKCPTCGKTPMEEENLGAVGRELGFNKSRPKRKQGVASCSSFTWATTPVEYASKLKRRAIYDEYGRKYSPLEFVEVLSECPIQFFDSIGKEFS